MGLTELIFRGPTKASIGLVELDASVKEVHRIGAKVTRHPIEADPGKPSDISDHVQVDPLSIQIDGVVSGTPVIFAAFLRLQGRDPVGEAHEKFLSTVLKGKIVTVVTTLKRYEDFVLERVEITRDAGKGNALFFSAQAVALALVSSEKIDLSQQRPPKLSTKGGGSSPAAASTTAVATKTSGAYKALKALLPGVP